VARRPAACTLLGRGRTLEHLMSDWTTDAADAIENAVTQIREKTVVPAKSFSKGLVYGILAVLIGLPAVLLVVIMLFRLFVIMFQGYVWAAWFLLGAIFIAAGWLAWAKRNP
jgi:uncharacterized membrane protein